MVVFPNAKINLGLDIISKRPDGYHNLETLFYPVGLSDILEVVPASSGADDELTLSGLPVDGDPARNLVMKALEVMRKHAPVPPVSVFLHKIIPSGAGLGGGSSDAAFMLLLLRDLFHLPFPDLSLEEMAASIGADCPFFIRNKPLLASGTGNIFTPCPVSLKGYELAIVKPGVSVSTAEAYSRVVPARPSALLCDRLLMPVGKWREHIKNDFEDSIFQKYAGIAAIKNELYRRGAVYASMSGSGSAVYGVFDRPINGLEAVFEDCSVWTGPAAW